MTDLIGVLKKRTVPGIMIFDGDNVLLYSNKEAFDMLPGPRKTRVTDDKSMDVINKLCAVVRNSGDCPQFAILHDASGPSCSVRSFFVNNIERNQGHIMVLMERIIEKHEIDFQDVMKRFDLTNREAEVLRLVSDGLSNRELSQRLFISEYTVKDHIKKLMKKMGASSRAVIMKKVNSLS